MGKKNRILNYCLIALGFVLMMAALYLVFVYVPTDKHTGIVQRIFYFHVPLAWVSFMAFAIVFVCSICYLRKRTVKWDALANAAAEIGVIFTTLVLVTGPLWAKPTWGIWWTWDARLFTGAKICYYTRTGCQVCCRGRYRWLCGCSHYFSGC